MIYGVSTGTLNDKDINESIKKIHSLNVNGIELMFPFEKDVDANLPLKKESLELLKTFKYISIHAPVLYDYRGKDEVLKKVFDLYKQIGAQIVVFHVVDYNLFKPVLEFDWNVCIENLMEKSHFTSDKMKFFIDKGAGLVLDISHTMENKEESDDTVKILVEKFKNNIKEVHLSYLKGKELHHQPLFEYKKKLEKLELLKELDCPIITETSFERREALEKEVEFVQQWLKN